MSFQIDPGDYLLGTLNTGIDVSATGATIAIWLKEPDFEDVTNYEYNLSLGFDSNLDDFLALILPTVADQVDAVTNQTGGPGSGANYTFTGNTEFDAKWTGFLATFDADETNRDVYFGKYENTATSSTLRSTSVLTRVGVGCAPTTFGGTQDSKIAEVAIWRKVLNEEQIRQYLAGRKASTIESQDLVGYWPLYTGGSTQYNEGIDSAGDLTNNGATWESDHPYIWEPVDRSPPLIVVRKPWTEQPPPRTGIDWSNPMTSGLIFAVGFTEGAVGSSSSPLVDGTSVPQGVDLVTGTIPTCLETGSGSNFIGVADYDAGSVGRRQRHALYQTVVLTNSDEVGLSYADLDSYKPNAVTCIARCKTEGIVADSGGRIISHSTGSGGDNYGLQIASTATLRWRWNNVSTDQSVTTTNKEWYMAGIGDSTDSKLYAWSPDGDENYLADGAGGTITYTGTSGIHVGCNGPTSDRSFDGFIYWVFVWDHVKSETFIRSIWNNPWQLFKPKLITGFDKDLRRKRVVVF